MIAEGNETPHTPRGEPPDGSGGSEGGGWRGEGDLLAERRARRAAEAPEHPLTLRAEAAEATVRTLESHLATVQQRLREAEAEAHRLQEALVAEASAPERGGSGEAAGRSGLLERELQRARQREQSEHRARVEAEDRAHAIEQDRAEIERLARRLSANERYVRALATQLHDLERRLLEAEERVRAADERARAAEARAQAAEAGANAEVRARVSALEHSAAEVGRGLERERAERERSERVLLSMRRGQRRVEALVRDLGTIVSRLRTQVTLSPPAPPAEASPRPLPGAAELAARGALADASHTREQPAAHAPDRSSGLESALEAAVERLRARAADAAPQQRERASELEEDAGARERGGASRAGVSAPAPRAPDPPFVRTAAKHETATALGEPSGATPLRAARLQAGPSRAPSRATPPPARPAPAQPQGAPAALPPSHKHSLSLIGRVRRARKQRRERR